MKIQTILLQIILLLVFVFEITSIKFFLIGGAAFQSSPLFKNLAETIVNRTPMPNKCDPNWKTTKCPRIAVITSSHQNQAEGNEVYNVDDSEGVSYKTLFNLFGMAPMHISVHADNYNETNNLSTPRGQINLDILSEADIYYFCGGDQSKHIRSWLNDDGTMTALLKIIQKSAIQNDVVLAGSSAGSMIWGYDIFGYGSSFGALYFSKLVKDGGLAPKNIKDAEVNGTNLSDMRNGTNCLRFDVNAGKMAGFGSGFKQFSLPIDTHFHARGRFGRLLPIMIEMKSYFAIGLDENTSVYDNNGLMKVYGGNGVTIIDLTAATINPTSEYLDIKNVNVHYLTEGDMWVWGWETTTLISSKTRIKTPMYKNFTDSDDIFASYEVSNLITHLIDQTPLFNQGYSKPDDPRYPTDTPTYQLKFYKDSYTVGYKNAKGQYTAQKVKMDIKASIKGKTSQFPRERFISNLREEGQIVRMQ